MAPLRAVKKLRSEILYYPAGVNISTELDNDWSQLGKEMITNPDGYYDICTLVEQVFFLQKVKLTLNPATVSVSNIKGKL